MTLWLKSVGRPFIIFKAGPSKAFVGFFPVLQASRGGDDSSVGSALQRPENGNGSEVSSIFNPTISLFVALVFSYKVTMFVYRFEVNWLYEKESSVCPYRNFFLPETFSEDIWTHRNWLFSAPSF